MNTDPTAPGYPSGSLRPISCDVHQLVRSNPDFALAVTRGPLTTVRRHDISSDATNPRVMFANLRNGAGHVLPGPHPLGITAELHGDQTIPITFGSSSRVVLQPGAIVWSDPIPVNLGAATHVETTTVVDSAGESLPVGSAVDRSRGESSCVRGSSRRDEPYGYSPWLLTGEVAHPRGPLVVVIGDSNAAGAGDRRGTAQHYGWVRRGIEPQADVVNLAVSGAQTIGGYAFQVPATMTPDIVFVALGGNDLQGEVDGSTLKDRLRTMLRRIGPVAPIVVLATITPHELDSCPPGLERARAAANEWIRSQPADCDAVLDIAAVTDDGYGHWRPGFSDDGIHASPTGHAAIGSAAAQLLDQLVSGSRTAVTNPVAPRSRRE